MLWRLGGWRWWHPIALSPLCIRCRFELWGRLLGRLVQEILGELVRLGHLGPAEALPAGLLGHQLVPVLPHAAAPLGPGDSASSADNRVKSEVSE